MRVAESGPCAPTREPVAWTACATSSTGSSGRETSPWLAQRGGVIVWCDQRTRWREMYFGSGICADRGRLSTPAVRGRLELQISSTHNMHVEPMMDELRRIFDQRATYGLCWLLSATWQRPKTSYALLAGHGLQRARICCSSRAPGSFLPKEREQGCPTDVASSSRGRLVAYAERGVAA